MRTSAAAPSLMLDELPAVTSSGVPSAYSYHEPRRRSSNTYPVISSSSISFSTSRQTSNKWSKLHSRPESNEVMQGFLFAWDGNNDANAREDCKVTSWGDQGVLGLDDHPRKIENHARLFRDCDGRHGSFFGSAH